jgi:EAL domain-containing protein (putative c-di-GMP-specific phosphodiesterase class I)
VHALQSAGFPLTVSVNLSMRDLQDPYVVESFAEQLEAREVDPRLIVLEITESAVMADTPRTMEILTRLGSMGLRIAVDDFGTGYSSLSYLKKLPVHTLKIDKSFIIGMNANDNDAAIVRTSIELAHNLGLEVVAEGVETELALKRLKALGCDMAQGHYLGRPLTATELEDWLMQSAWGFKGIVVKPGNSPPRLLS